MILTVLLIAVSVTAFAQRRDAVVGGTWTLRIRMVATVSRVGTLMKHSLAIRSLLLACDTTRMVAAVGR